MKIKEIKIENFGKLSRFNKVFSDGVNTVNEENGWGKSTLISFIRVMFFGFDNETKNKKEREREIVRPWQGGTYGGSIVFEANGKEYRMNRTFGNKPAEDTFELYDNKTNIESKDYTKNIGEELFGLNAESFKRTVFITQNDVETGTTDGINAKISSLSGATDDIDNYQMVEKKINDKINSLSSTRATGEIHKLKNEITSLESEVRIIPTVEANIDSKNKSLEELKKALEENKAETEKLGNELKEASKAEALNSKKAQYESICGRYNVKKSEKNMAEAVFTVGIPDGVELDGYIAEAERIEEDEKKAIGYRLTPEEEGIILRDETHFAHGIPSSEDIEYYKTVAENISSKERKYAALQFSEEENADYEKYSKKFEGKGDIEEKVINLNDKLSAASEIRAEISKKTALLENTDAKKSVLWLVLLVIGIAAAVIGAVVFHGVSNPLGIVSICIGVILAAAGIAVKISSSNKEKKASEAQENLRREIGDLEKSVDDTEKDVKEFLKGFGITCELNRAQSSLYDIRNEYRRYRSLVEKEADRRDDVLLSEIESEKEKLNAFLLPYGGIFDSENDYMSKLHVLGFRSENYAKLKSKKNSFDAASGDISSKKKPVLDYIESLGFAVGEFSLCEKLRDIKNKFEGYRRAAAGLAEVENEKKAFESTNDIAEITSGISISGLKSVDEINRLLKEVSDEKDGITEKMSYYSSQLSEDLERLDALHEKTEELSEKKALYENLIKKEELFTKTRDLLKTAKESFTGKYSSKVAAGFKKYYELAEGTPGNEYSFDANMKLMIDDHGGYKDISSYSSGSRDKIGICFRMGLIEAMYPDEKPVIIMDDPFTNLDERRIEGGRKILDALKNDYQIIYLTCHESRMPAKA